MLNVTLFDTSAASDNIGDEIIMDSVESIIHEVLPDAYMYRVATHECMTRISKRYLKKSDFSIVGGTNILSSYMGNRHELWRLFPWDAIAFNHAILLGVGWRNYMKPPSVYTRWLLNRILSSNRVHSVRDEYTRQRLNGSVKEVLNTACPTMWRLTEEHCASIPHTKGTSAVTTLTHYLRDLEADTQLFKVLQASYKHLYFWPQQSEDAEYFSSLNISGVKIVPPSLARYDNFLEHEDVDFIGTRLHGGIRALQKQKRTLILAVDNRATEILKDTNLPVVQRDNIAAIEQFIGTKQACKITLPTEKIAQWKAQFSS